jgi:hypothetical protein
MTSGEFQSVPGQKHDTGRQFTTAETIRAEKEVLRQMQQGQNRAQPIMTIQDAVKHTGKYEILNTAQQRAAEEILTSRDAVQGLQGFAGVGKTTALKTVREAAEQRGYPNWTNPDAEFFHGTTKTHADAILRDGIDPARGAALTDFGSGFYTTSNHAQAEEWAKIRAVRDHDVPAILRLRVNRAALARLRHLSFVLPTPDFWSLVERCRDKSGVPYPTGQHYDVIYGPVARRLDGSKAYGILEGYDQTSFHGDAAKTFLNDTRVCKVEEVS